MSESKAAKVQHPAGLYVLFFTEMWERFGFYLMIGILPLYLRDTVAHGGKGMDVALSTEIIGTYVALVYLTPFIGGLLADRYLGYRRSILLGAFLMGLGYFMIAIPGGNLMLYASLLVIILGNGFFKPNISTLLGNMYNQEQLKPKKDSAYNIFYMGINIGAFVCNFVGSYLRLKYTWGHAFAAAGVGMGVGFMIFFIGQSTVKHADVKRPLQEGDMPISQIVSSVFLPAIAFGVFGWFVPHQVLGHNVLKNNSNDAFIFICIPIVFFYFRLWARAEGADRRRIATLLTLFGVSIVFWNIYNQNSTALTTWAEQYTHRDMPRSMEPALASVDLVEKVDAKLSDVPVLDRSFHTQLDASGHVVTHQGTNPYLQNLPKDRWPAEGQDLKLISTELYQSINPFWIIILTPIIVGLFGWLRSRGKEPNTPSKMAIGILVAGASSVVMIAACMSTDIYSNKVSSAWIFASYGVFTISELFLSPIGLSLVSKVAPRRITALMMGGWMLTTSIGGKISAILAGFWDQFDNKAIFFAISAGAALVAGLVLFPLTNRLSKVVDEAVASEE